MHAKYRYLLTITSDGEIKQKWSSNILTPGNITTSNHKSKIANPINAFKRKRYSTNADTLGVLSKNHVIFDEVAVLR